MDAAAAARRWAEHWQRDWEALDTEAIVALYHARAQLSTEPFRVPYSGQDGVRDYVSHVFGETADARVWVGEPIVNGDRAAIEWWAAETENGIETTLAGTSMLRFDADGLVVEQRDTWNQAHGRREPPAGWGR
ncbi:MAG TPA: nuclear transport factor 2 family protein [Candidatus Limnocylindria bacterium]|jgi:SnoaL-like domain|nr:nuclear transport factor 2 family protein [Candidatus Limnocylindria bacterium]